jgi:uncharacterized membrane protein
VRVNSQIVVRAPRSAVWDTITDAEAYLDFMAGITRWEVDDGGDSKLGLGSRVRMLIRVGAAQVGGLIEIVECSQGSDLAWSSVTGIDQRGRWRLRNAGDGLTRVELRYSYGVAGAGIAGLVAERVAAPILSRRLRRSLVSLKLHVERERRRADTPERSRAPA